ncbi:MAG: reverse transcriptase domain-containing protein [Cyanobacteria bacterium J06582_2]
MEEVDTLGIGEIIPVIPDNDFHNAWDHPPPPIGARLVFFAEEWAAISEDPWVSQVCRDGYEIPFSQPPPLSEKPFSMTSYQPNSEKAIALQDQLKSLLQKQAIEVVTEDWRGFYNRLFVVPKQEKEWRPVLDVSRLNKYVILTKFKMESPTSVLQSIRPFDWMSSIDLTDAYFHVPIHPRSKRFLRFFIEGKTYQFRALPFGLATAPQVFTRVFAQVVRWLHLRQVRIICYLDDWLILSHSKEQALKNNQIILNLSKRLGFLVNKKKSSLDPSQETTYLGMIINSAQFWVKPTQNRIERFSQVAQDFTIKQEQTARQWQVILGHMSSLEKLIPYSRLRMRTLQWQLNQFWRPSQGPNVKIPLTQEVTRDVHWWLIRDRLLKGRSLREEEVQIYLYSDASTEGWGATVDNMKISGCWSQQEKEQHINVLELKAVKLALLKTERLVAGKIIAVMMDNLTALAYIRKQGGLQSKTLLSVARDLLLWTEAKNIILKPSFVPGDLNVMADSLSRSGQILKKEWILHHEVCQRIWSLWGRPFWDLFATRDNFRLERYVSPVMDHQAEGVDAMLMDWSNKTSYAFPPFNLLPHILKKLQQSENAKMILIAPFWPRQGWFGSLCLLLTEAPRRLPMRPDLLRQPYVKANHKGLKVLALTAWSLSSVRSETKVFQERLHDQSLKMLESQQTNYTNNNGHCLGGGVFPEDTLLTLPL